MSTATLPAEETGLAKLSTSLLGKTALVTGGSRGIGKAIALALAAQGADVGITCYTGCKFADDVRSQIADLDRKAAYYSHDIGYSAEVEKLARDVAADFPKSILVNNAGITRDRSFKKMTQAMWDAVLGVNLTGVFMVTKQFIDPTAERGWGRVINISSIVVGNFGQEHVSSMEIAKMSIDAGHIGPAVSSEAHRRLWPEAAMWIADHSTVRKN